MTSDPSPETGIRFFRQKKYPQAIQVFQECLDFYIQTNDTLTAAEMRNNLSVAFLQNREPQKAYEIVLGSDRVFENAGDKRRQAMAISNTATALESLHRHVEALDLYKTSIALLDEINEKELRTDVFRRIAVLQMKLGRGLEAVSSMESSLESGKSPRGAFLNKVLKAVKKFFLGF